MQCRSHSRRRTSECLFVTACSMDEYAEEKRTEKNLIVRSGISEAETTNNKRLRSTFCIEAIQTRSIARPLCDSRASCLQIPSRILSSWMLRSCTSWQHANGPVCCNSIVFIGPSSMATGSYDMIACFNQRADLLIYRQIQLD